MKNNRRIGNFMKCLTDEQIAVYIDGRKADREFDSIKKHLAGCDKCLAKMNEVYTLLELDKKKLRGMQKPPMPITSSVRSFRYRYFIPAIAAAALVIISLTILKLQIPLNIIPDKTVKITNKNTGSDNDVRANNGLSKNIFVLNIKSGRASEINRDARKISAQGISINSMASLNQVKSSGTSKMSIDERLAFERKTLLIRCGYYYYMLKQTRDRSLFNSVRDIMELAFPGVELDNLKDSAFDNYEKSITKQNSTDRGNFIKGFYLSYYLYTDGKIEPGNDSLGAVIESLKDEEAFGIKNLFIFKGDELGSLKADMKKFFMM